MNKEGFQIHLVSDCTGNTLDTLMKACLSQFDGVDVEIHKWPLTSSLEQIDLAVASAEETGGMIWYTMVEPDMVNHMEKLCKEKGVACFSAISSPLKSLSGFFKSECRAIPGLKHKEDASSYERMAAVDYAMKFDESQADIEDLKTADVIIVGPSRTSKTPTCIYLANKCIKAANLPFSTANAFPNEVLKLKEKLIVGLIAKPERLADLRRTRLKIFDTFIQTDYLDKNAIEEEVRNARVFYSSHSWPIIDITNRSVEDVCDDIIVMLENRGRKYK